MALLLLKNHAEPRPESTAYRLPGGVVCRIERSTSTASRAEWRALPAAVVLETCKFLDAAALGRLEICGRGALGDRARAWKAQTVGVARGTLGHLSNRAFAAAHARVQVVEALPPPIS